MRTIIHVDTLESRTNPSAPLPGWTVPYTTTTGYYDGFGHIGVAYTASAGGSADVQIWSNQTNRPDGENWVKVFDKVEFDPAFRNGANAATLPGSVDAHVPGQADPISDSLLVGTGIGGGPVLAQIHFNATTGTLTDSLTLVQPYDPNEYRGGIDVSAGVAVIGGPVLAFFLPADKSYPSHFVAEDLNGPTPKMVASFYAGPNGAQFTPDSGSVQVPHYPTQLGVPFQYGTVDPVTNTITTRVYLLPDGTDVTADVMGGFPVEG